MLKNYFAFVVGIKDAFTKSEPKIDLMLSQAIVNECEADSLLTNLKNRWNLEHRYDAEIELLIDDGDELSFETDSSAISDKKVLLQLLV